MHSEGEGHGCAFTVELPMALSVAGDRSCRHKRSQSHSRSRGDHRSVTADADISVGASASVSASADDGADVGGVTTVSTGASAQGSGCDTASVTATGSVSVQNTAASAQSLGADSLPVVAGKTAPAGTARSLPPVLPPLALPDTGSGQGAGGSGPLNLSTAYTIADAHAHANAIARALEGEYADHGYPYVPPLTFDDTESAPISARGTHPHTPFRSPRVGRSYRLLVVDDSQLNRKVGARLVER